MLSSPDASFWNEIRHRAIAFSKDWTGVKSERAEKQTFWDEFFEVDLYDALAMPLALVKAHAELDRAVDLCYRLRPFQNDRQRVEHLFALYEKLMAPLVAPAKKRRRKALSN